jgi:hypothetical protein
MGVLGRLSDEAFLTELRACCSSQRWARQMLRRRPFESLDDLLKTARDEWYRLDPQDWQVELETFCTLALLALIISLIMYVLNKYLLLQEAFAAQLSIMHLGIDL